VRDGNVSPNRFTDGGDLGAKNSGDKSPKNIGDKSPKNIGDRSPKMSENPAFSRIWVSSVDNSKSGESSGSSSNLNRNIENIADNIRKSGDSNKNDSSRSNETRKADTAPDLERGAADGGGYSDADKTSETSRSGDTSKFQQQGRNAAVPRDGESVIKPTMDLGSGVLCTCCTDENAIRIWEIDFNRNQQHLLTEVCGHDARCAVRVGGSLWVGCWKRNILVFDPTDWGIYTVVRVNEGIIGMVYVESVDEVWVATPVRVISYNPQSKKSHVVVSGERSTCLVAVGQKVWVAGKDNSIKIWDAKTKMCHHTIVTGLLHNINHMTVCGNFVWCASDTIVVFNSETYEQVIELNQHKGKINFLLEVPSFVSVIPELWSAGSDQNVKIWSCVEMS